VTRESRGDRVGASPVDRGKPGSKLHLVCDGSGLPLTAAVTAANVPDVIVLVAMVDDIPPVRPRHPGGGRCQRTHPPDAIRAGPVDLAGLRSQVRSGAHRPGSASRPWAGSPHAPPSRAGRAVDLAGGGRLHPAAPGPRGRRRSAAAVGAARHRKQLSSLRVRRRSGPARRCPAVKQAAWPATTSTRGPSRHRWPIQRVPGHPHTPPSGA
jgi:hypothetical protein